MRKNRFRLEARYVPYSLVRKYRMSKEFMEEIRRFIEVFLCGHLLMLHLNVSATLAQWLNCLVQLVQYKAKSNSTCDPFFVTFRLCLCGFAQGRADRNEEVCVTL